MKLSRRTFAISLAAFGAMAPCAARADDSADMSIGAADAPLQLTEYASATCSHCAHFHETNWAILKAEFIDPGRVRLTLREMATPPEALAFSMFQLARCGDADGPEYFQRLGVLFARQRAIFDTGTMIAARAALAAIGAEWGLTASQITASFAEREGYDRLARSIADAAQRGVTGTPTFFIDDERMGDPGFLTPEGMRQILNASLARR